MPTGRTEPAPGVNAPTTVFLVDDHTIVRASLRALLSQQRGFVVVGDCGDPLQALGRIEAAKPELVLLDVTMPGLSGLDLLPKIRAVHPGVRIVMVTHLDSHDVRARALAGGADGFVSKNAPFEELVATIGRVLRGEAPRAGAAGPTGQQGPLASLTAREREVLQLLVVGKPNKEVAARLGVSLSTIKKHRENLQRKLGCRSSAELTLVAIREGLIQA